VNDGTALVFYRVAVTAAVAGTFSIWDASWRLLWSIVGGVAIGLIVGFLIAEVRRRIDNPPVEVTIALLTGYVAFIPANAVGASGVLAVVTAGIYLGWRTPELTSYQTRLQGAAVWEIFTFVLNALLFALVGLQLPRILDALTGFSAAKLMWWGLLVTATVVVARLVFVPVFTYLPRRFLGAFDPSNPPPPPARGTPRRTSTPPSSTIRQTRQASRSGRSRARSTTSWPTACRRFPLPTQSPARTSMPSRPTGWCHGCAETAPRE